MSVTNPLIKEIKEWIAKYLEDYNLNVPITDDNLHLSSFCACLEKIFTQGLSTHYNSFGFVKQFDAWNWLENLEMVLVDSANFNYTCSIEYVKICKNIFTNTGRLRLLLRTCLVKKCLHIPVMQLIHNNTFHKYYYPDTSILGDEILIEILLSVLMQCSKFMFKLDLKNSSFLDLSWTLPKVVQMELVPCKSLGISLTYAYEKAIVVNVEPNSVASEDGHIEVGDILDELNEVHICACTRGKLSTIMRKGIGKPITLKIIKAFYNDNIELYPPLIPLLQHTKISPDSLRNKHKTTNKDIQCVNKSAGYQVKYIGSVSTGSSGDVREIDRAIKILLKAGQSEFGPKVTEVNKEVCFEIGEIGVKVTDAENEVLFNHSYMEISSCGTVNTLKDYFAYIAGEQICNLAKDFRCHIYSSKSDEDIFTILQSIGQGFHRTHFAV